MEALSFACRSADPLGDKRAAEAWFMVADKLPVRVRMHDTCARVEVDVRPMTESNLVRFLQRSGTLDRIAAVSHTNTSLTGRGHAVRGVVDNTSLSVVAVLTVDRQRANRCSLAEAVQKLVEAIKRFAEQPATTTDDEPSVGPRTVALSGVVVTVVPTVIDSRLSAVDVTVPLATLPGVDLMSHFTGDGGVADIRRQCGANVHLTGSVKPDSSSNVVVSVSCLQGTTAANLLVGTDIVLNLLKSILAAYRKEQLSQQQAAQRLHEPASHYHATADPQPGAAARVADSGHFCTGCGLQARTRLAKFCRVCGESML